MFYLVRGIDEELESTDKLKAEGSARGRSALTLA